LLIVAFVLPARLAAQSGSFLVGIQGGPTRSILYGNTYLSQGSNAAINFASGLILQYGLSKHFSLRLDPSFERKGSKRDGLMILPNNNSFSQTYSRTNFDYIVAPLLINGTFGRKVQLLVNAGGYFGLLLREQEKTVVEGETRVTDNNTNNFQRADYGAVLGLGVAVPFCKQFKASLEVRNNIGFNDISVLPVMNNGAIKNNSTQLLFGCVYTIED
jgi:hypothetical protein